MSEQCDGWGWTFNSLGGSAACAGCVRCVNPHEAKQSKGGVPEPMTVDALLDLDDGNLAAMLIGAMSVNAKTTNYSAFGRVLRTGINSERGREDLSLALRRSGR